MILIGAGTYVGWNIGANDTANCIGTTVGAGLLTFKQAVVLVSIFAILGAMLQGEHVMKTIGKGIVSAELDYRAVMVALLCSGFFVTLATFFRIPTSTSQAIVGGVVGIGLAVGAKINAAKFFIIAESWLICPVLVLVLSFCLFHALSFVLRRLRVGPLLLRNALGWAAVLSSCYVAYSMGANNAGNAVGPIANLGVVHPRILLAVGGAPSLWEPLATAARWPTPWARASHPWTSRGLSWPRSVRPAVCTCFPFWVYRCPPRRPSSVPWWGSAW